MCKHLSGRVKMIGLRFPSPWTFGPRQGPAQRTEHGDSSPLSSREQAGATCCGPCRDPHRFWVTASLVSCHQHRAHPPHDRLGDCRNSRTPRMHSAFVFREESSSTQMFLVGAHTPSSASLPSMF